MAKKAKRPITEQMLKRFAIVSGKGFRLRDVDPQDTIGTQGEGRP